MPYGTAQEHATIRAVVQAYADGKIELEPPESMRDARFAPSFIPKEPEPPTKTRPKEANTDRAGICFKPYNAYTIAGFIGWFK